VKLMPLMLKAPAIAWNEDLPVSTGEYCNAPASSPLKVASTLTVSFAAFVFPTIVLYLSAKAIYITGISPPLCYPLILDDVLIELSAKLLLNDYV
jgi:hypothetical protein